VSSRVPAHPPSQPFIRLRRRCLASLCVAVISPHAAAEPFIGQFELKTLESAPGLLEFQSQNAWAWDQPRRRIATDEDGAVIMDENALFRERYALELEIGWTSRVKMRFGIELENERIDDPGSSTFANEFEGLRLEEIGAEIVAVLVPRDEDGAGLGVVVEVEGPIDQEGPNSLILGPIIEYQSGPWFFAAVPALVRAFGGKREQDEPRDDKWDFAYALQLMHRFSSRWALALEGYGTIERLGNTGHRSEAAERFGDSDQHRLGPVLYFAHPLTFGPRQRGEEEAATLTIGLGLLEGLTSHTADHTLKLSIEVDF